MDISQSIIYRTLNLNSALLETGRVLRGITVENADYSSVEAVGYTEKRAGADGMHASDVYLGPRAVDLSGHIYAPTLAEYFDYLHVLRAVFSPTSAYAESPGDRGFLPLTFTQPTTDEASFPGGVIPLYMNLRPRANVRFNISRDRQNDKAVRPVATPWAVQLIAKDPRVYVSPGQVKDLAGGPHPSTNGEAINRGDYETPLNIQLVKNTAPTTDQTFRLTGLNGIDMTIKIKAGLPATIYRWFGDDRVLMTEDVSGGVGTSPLVLRMDLVTFATKNRRPSVPASINPPIRPFSSAYTFSSTTALDANSRMFWSEAFA